MKKLLSILSLTFYIAIIASSCSLDENFDEMASKQQTADNVFGGTGDDDDDPEPGGN